jgi:hypothetical protein
MIQKTLFILLLWFPIISVSAQDLAVYEVKGPVKQIKWKSMLNRPYPIPYFQDTQKFTRSGRLIGFEQRYYAERDRKGRMKREGMDPTDAYHWHYDRLGRVIWVFYNRRGDYEFTPKIIYPFYTTKGEVGKYRIHYGDPSDIGDVLDELTVHVTERDSHGNWTKRRHVSSDGRNTYIEERSITYY